MNGLNEWCKRVLCCDAEPPHDEDDGSSDKNAQEVVADTMGPRRPVVTFPDDLSGTLYFRARTPDTLEIARVTLTGE